MRYPSVLRRRRRRRRDARVSGASHAQAVKEKRVSRSGTIDCCCKGAQPPSLSTRTHGPARNDSATAAVSRVDAFETVTLRRQKHQEKAESRRPAAAQRPAHTVSVAGRRRKKHDRLMHKRADRSMRQPVASPHRAFRPLVQSGKRTSRLVQRRLPDRTCLISGNLISKERSAALGPGRRLGKRLTRREFPVLCRPCFY